MFSSMLIGRYRILRSLAPLVFIGSLASCTAEGGGDWAAGAGEVLGGVFQGGGALGSSEIAAGLKEALKVGTDRVVGTLGVENGFNADPKVHIPLPKVLAQTQSSLRLVGASGLVDDLELRINRAAEQATPVAKEIFWNAISNLTFEDVNAIYQGPNDAATQYLDSTTRSTLNEAMRPIVDNALNGAMDGLFAYLALEEAAIREDPLKRSTDLLKRVFGAPS
ncbi:MAG: DUF4197 domain-containing protein [Geminicoccaceae bacterium]